MTEHPSEEKSRSEIGAARLSRKKKKKRKKLLFGILIALAVIVLLLVGGYFGLRAYGKYQLNKKTEGESIVLEENEALELEVYDENTIVYQGQTYTYNDEMMNIVFMGIDQTAEAQEDEGVQGRSDLIILASVDNQNETVTLINVNRNTMTEIAIYDANGNYLRQATTQIALAHSYGDGKEESAQLVCDAVSNLFYGLPVNAYCALNLDAIPVINDAVGGVTLTLLEDYTDLDSTYVQGAEVTLMGEAALQYVRQRDIYVDESNEDRMERQKQYMSAFVSKAKQVFSSDLTLPFTLYSAIEPYMVTDISIDQATYLVTQILGYEINGEMLTLQGTVAHGAIYEEYYVDEAALYDLIVQTYYIPVE